MDRTVLDELGTSLETEDETTCVITEHNLDKTSPQEEKIDNAVDEKQTINQLSSNSLIRYSSHTQW